MEITDALNRKIFISTIPQRIVSLVPSQTELLVDMGLRDQIVGVTKFCVHPGYLRKEKTVVGGTKQVHFDIIKNLKPDIILCNKEENTQEMVLELEKIAPVWVSAISTVDDCCKMIVSLGQLFSKQKTAVQIVYKIQLETKNFSDFIKGKPTLKVAYLIWKDPYMVAGNDTFINTLLELNNFKNVFFEKDGRYPEVILEELNDAKLILLSSEPYPFNEKHILEIKAVVKNKKILLVDGEYFSWYGSRLIKAFTYFKELHTKI
jgi:ABC-type Fe3+-hydroxamate transport system substrate-binding protein